MDQVGREKGRSDGRRGKEEEGRRLRRRIYSGRDLASSNISTTLAGGITLSLLLNA